VHGFKSRCLVIMLVCLCKASGRSIGVGVKAGVPLTENFQTGIGGYTHTNSTSSSKTRRYTVGVSASAHLPFRLGVEIDALYRRLNYDWFATTFVSSADGGLIYTWSNASGNRLDVPILLRWSPIRHLYAVGGPSFGIHYGFDEQLHTIQNLVIAGYSDKSVKIGEPFAHRVSSGVTFGLGWDAGTGGLHVKPEVRCSHWISSAFDGFPELQPSTNDVELLLGFEFGGAR
jgi:Outer membrane protein beta-barrel domain